MTFKPVVLMDVDGVLCDYVGGVLAAARGIGCSVPRSRHAIAGWEIERFLELSKQQRAKLYKAICAEGFCRDLKPLDGARKGLKALREHATIYFVTTPTDSRYWLAERVEWLREYFGADFSEIIFAHEKKLITGDVIVDDKLDHVLSKPRSAAVLWLTSQNVTEARELAYLSEYFPALYGLREWSTLSLIVREVGKKLSNDMGVSA